MNSSDENQVARDLEDESESRQWLVTFADMTTLLLTFFVLLLTFAQLDQDQFKKIMRSVRSSLGSTETRDAVGRPDAVLLSVAQDPLLRTLSGLVRRDGLGANITYVRDRNRLVIRVNGAILFGSGTYKIKKTAYRTLNLIARVLNKFPVYKVHISGHTDNVPLKGSRLGNWELSALRASEVLRYFILQDVDPERMTATGYAHIRPLTGNDTPANRALNRRVEFVLQKEKN